MKIANKDTFNRILKRAYDSIFKNFLLDAETAGINQQTARRMANGDSISEANFIALSKLLGVHPTELTEDRTGQGYVPFSYNGLLTFAKKIDYQKLNFFDKKSKKQTYAFNQWQDRPFWYHGRDYKFDRINIDHFFHDRLSVNYYELKLLGDVAKANLDVKATGEKLDLSLTSASLPRNEQTNEVIPMNVSGFQLLWPCNCMQSFVLRNISAHHKLNVEVKKRLLSITETNCPIHGSHEEKSKQISNLFGNVLCNISVENIDIVWQNDEHLWPPSIDVFIFINFLKGYFQKKLTSPRFKKPRRVLDAGAGTGILGIWLKKYFDSIESICYSDWMFHSMMFCYVNHYINFKSIEKPYANFRLEHLLESTVDDKFDICVCNPPYLPNPADDPKLYSQSSVTGIDLLKEFIQIAPKICMNNYLIFSNLAKKPAYQYAEECGTKLERLSDWYEIPFRVSHYLKSHDNIVSYLNSGELFVDTTKKFPLRHKVAIFKVS